MEDRRSLFRSSSILSHVEGDGPTAFIHKRITESTQLSGGGPDKCTSYFIEPVQWMEPALLGVMEGQVNVLYFLFIIIFCQDKLLLFPHVKAPTHCPRSRSLSCINFADHWWILRCEISSYKEMSLRSCWPENTGRGVGRGFVRLKNLLWSRAGWGLTPGTTPGVISCISTPSLLPAQLSPTA